MNVEFSDIVKMKPWIGEYYLSSKPRILILGLSVYGGRSRKERIESMINSVKTNEWTHSFFTRILNTFNSEDHWFKIEEGKEDYYLDKDSFWSTVAFYEYLLHIFDKPKDKIDNKYFEEAKMPFIEVIKKLEPDIVLCMGFETYDNLPEIGEYYKTFNYKNEEIEVWKYSIAEKTTYACRIKHPSSGNGFKSEIWSELYNRVREDLGF